VPSRVLAPGAARVSLGDVEEDGHLRFAQMRPRREDFYFRPKIFLNDIATKLPKLPFLFVLFNFCLFFWPLCRDFSEMSGYICYINENIRSRYDEKMQNIPFVPTEARSVSSFLQVLATS